MDWPCEPWDALDVLEGYAHEPAFPRRWRTFLRSCTLLVSPGLPPEAREWVSAADEFDRGRLTLAGLDKVRVQAWRLHDACRASATPGELGRMRVAMQRLWPPESPERWHESAWHFLHCCEDGGPPVGQWWPLLRDVFGPLPLRPVAVDPAWLTWNGCTVRRLAEAAHEDRHPSGDALDNGGLAVLADALEEAGCEEGELLSHLRQMGAVHFPGCWVVDLLITGD